MLIDPPPLFLSAPFPRSLSLPLSFPYPFPRSLPSSPFLSRFPTPPSFPRSLSPFFSRFPTPSLAPSSPFLSRFPTPPPPSFPRSLSLPLSFPYPFPRSLLSLPLSFPYPPSFPRSLSPFLSRFPTPHPSLPSLPSPQPPRHVHPVVWFSTVDTPPLLVENFPFDKYELEPSPLTQYILAKKNPHICWQVCTERGVVIMP